MPALRGSVTIPRMVSGLASPAYTHASASPATPSLNPKGTPPPPIGVQTAPQRPTV